MSGKEQIVEELGDKLLPNLVNKALLANDRAKYLMTLLQAAREYADYPEGGLANLKEERIACGVEDPAFDFLVERSSKEAGDAYRIPSVGRVHDEIIDNVRSMIAPVELAAASLQGGYQRVANYQQSLDGLLSLAPSLDNDLIAGSYIDQITSAQPSSGDSVHLLVMSLHKELNRLQQQIAAESINGARVYGVSDSDRVLIEAFMQGINRTAKLKFDHPGLDTTATRTEDKLVIQNDIGTTDAHVLVVHVTAMQVAVTYTDVHIQRLIFFQNLLRPFAVQWEDTRSRHSSKLTENLYHLSIGRYLSEDETERAAYLEHLGSRLVFLIDWNRARKRLRKLAPKRVCLDVLQWAADNELGHMAFLKAGGDQIVFDALQLSSPTPLQLGGQLSDIIGPEHAAEFLKFTLKTAAEGLLAGHSELLVRDQVRAELRHYLDTVHQGLLELAADHAALTVELATCVRDCLLPSGSRIDTDYIARAASRAKKWEHQADELVTKARTSPGERNESKTAAELLRVADNAADDLEEAVFLLTLFDQLARPADDNVVTYCECRDLLREMADLLVRAAQEYLKAVENARHIDRSSSREEMGDFLTAIDNTISLEHATDDAHRRNKASIVTLSKDHRQLHLFTEFAGLLESGADAMMRAALMLKDYVLGEVITR